MPYSVARGKGCSPEKPWAVVKDTDGSVVACHESKESALGQIRALYAAEPALAKARARLTKVDPKAPPKDRIKGSDTNEEGSASGKRGDIEVSEATETALSNKADEHNTKMADEDRPAWTRVSVGAIRSVYRRGSGAFSGSHRPGIGRSQWAMARVNAFLTLASTGKPANPKYIGDNDLLHPDHPRASGQPARKQIDVQIDLWKHLGQQHDQSVHGEWEQPVTKTNRIARFLPTVLRKHLSGQHDQRSHGKRGGGVGASREESRAKQKMAWELHEQGKTWEEVAREAGYANGGAARLAGLQHKKRLDQGEGGGEKKKLDDGDTPTPKKVTPKEGAAAIAQSQAIIDKATGGKTMREALDEAHKKIPAGPERDKRVAELTEATVQAGAVLRAEAERRIALEGGPELEAIRERTPKLEKEITAATEKYHKLTTEQTMIEREGFALLEPARRTIISGEAKRVKENLGVDEDAFNADVAELGAITWRGAPQKAEGMAPSWDLARQVAERRFPNDREKQYKYRDEIQRTVSASDIALHRYEMYPEGRAAGERLGALRDRRAALIEEVRLTNNTIYEKRAELSRDITLAELGGVEPARRAEIIKDVLSESGRTMSTKQGQRIQAKPKALEDELRTELSKIPDELWNPTKYPQLKVTASRSRGHWSSSKQEIKTDGDGGRKASTLLHEATHAVEDMNPSVTRLQRGFLQRRISPGEQPQKLQKLLPGHGYRKDEVAYADKFSDPYSGKTYSWGNFEIMTMGIESLYRRRNYPSRLADDDHLDFVMGVLAHA